MFDVALPREAHELGENNYLGESLGQQCPIDFQCVLTSTPNPSAQEGHYARAHFWA